MTLAPCTRAHAPEILAIFNDAILHTTALYDYKPRTTEFIAAWFDTKERGNFPVLGAFTDDGSLAGFATYGTFRAFPAFKYSVEHSVYVHAAQRSGGIGKALLHALIAEATTQNYHTLVGAIDSTNAASVRLHTSLGFVPCGRIAEAGYKFGRWLDLDFYQLILPTPTKPTDGTDGTDGRT